MMIKKYFIFSRRSLIILLLFVFLVNPSKLYASGQLWEITSVDTMKFSRDESRNPAVVKLIPMQVKAAADLGAKYVAIDTPYDDEFLPRMSLWVKAARENNLKVWFRGNFAGWEGWFDYPKLSSASEHQTKTLRFITQNPDLFQDGDIFTPAPEAEAGILGDPRQTRKFAQFNQFLIDSYDNCNQAFAKINKQVNCGVWSLNTDVLRDVVTKETIDKLGGVISIDHYTKTPEKLVTDVQAIKTKFNAKVVLGEFGAPIPDLNGQMTDDQQAQYLADLFDQLYQHPDLVYGMNYWVLNGGSTKILNDDNSPRPAYFAIQKYYQPIMVSGQIIDQFNKPVSQVQLETADKLAKAQTDNEGKFTITLPAKTNNLNFSRSDLISVEQQILPDQDQQFNFIMLPAKPDFWYKLRLWFYNHFTKK